jgi:hypothetical protein
MGNVGGRAHIRERILRKEYSLPPPLWRAPENLLERRVADPGGRFGINPLARSARPPTPVVSRPPTIPLECVGESRRILGSESAQGDCARWHVFCDEFCGGAWRITPSGPLF